MENQTLYIVLGVTIFFLVIFLMPWGGSCSECYKPSGSAKFAVNRPKYVVQPSYPKQQMTRRENYVFPPMSQTPMLSAPNLVGGGFNKTTDNPFMGFPQGSIDNGPSNPINPNSMPMSGQTGSESINVYKTII